MGSSDTGTGVVDCSVGAIVWVRRRNGSWWPGKILGPDELSASHLMSPRSGTPVKLLGREDASVDWYNLEKSKRVKAFRCGEFDDCIERAEASQGIPPKKREKYARREDAILHALELEKQLLEKKYGKLGCSSNGKSGKLSDGVKKELATSSECLGYGNGKHVHPKSHKLSKGLDSSLEDKNKGHHLHEKGVKEGNQMRGDGDNSDVLPRMRGLQDFGLRTAASKRKLSSSVASNGSQKPAFDASIHAPPNGGQTTENIFHANSENFLDKRKILNDGLAEESLIKRRDKRHPLVQVLESSAKLLVSHSLQPDGGRVSLSMSGEEQTEVVCGAERSRYAYLSAKFSDCLEDKEIHPDQMEISTSKFEEINYSHTAVLSEDKISGSTEDTETDSSGTDSTESGRDEAMDALSDDNATIELRLKTLGRSDEQGEHGCPSTEEPDDLPLASDMSHPHRNAHVSASVGVSKWQLKGKRNNRSLTKRYLNVTSGDEADLIEKKSRTQMVGYGSRGLDGISSNSINWEESAWNDQPVFVGRHTGGRMTSMLVDVDLKVQSGYQREHVPMISLMSKLNGKAIVGHPIQIETLEIGSSETLLAAADGFFPETLDYDTALPPLWRTARRTANCRVPRPHSSSTLDGDEDAQHVDRDRKVLFRKPNAGSLSHKAGMLRSGRPQKDRKILRKPPKKSSLLSSSPKIRTLSSIATQQKHSNDLKHGSYKVDGLIKPETAPTAVACIPVKLVFSRLYEELVGRHQ